MVTEQPLGQLPLYKSTDGELIMSNSIARYVAKRYGKCTDYPVQINSLFLQVRPRGTLYDSYPQRPNDWSDIPKRTPCPLHMQHP